MEQYCEAGTDIKALVEAQKEKARKHGDELTDDAAFDEVVADSCERMLLDSNALSKLAEFAAESESNRGIVEKIRDFIKKCLTRLRELYANKPVNSLEAQTVAEMRDAAEKLHSLFEDALMDAANAGRSASTTVSDGNVKHARKTVSDYSYASLTSKPDMKITIADPNNVPKNRADIVSEAKKRATKFGKFDAKDGSVKIHVNDIGRDVVLGTNGLRHGLDRRVEILAPVVLNAGEILQNSVQVNELIPRNANINESYVLVGVAKNSAHEPYIVSFVVNRYTNEVSSVDVLYSVNTKTEAIEKGSAGSLSPGVPAPSADRLTDPAISIARLLEYVNRYFPDILSEDVLRHFGHTSRPEGVIGESAIFSRKSPDGVSDRAALVETLKAGTNNPDVKAKLDEWAADIDKMEAEEDKLRSLKAQIKELSFAKGERDIAKLRALRDEATKTQNRISIYDKKILNIEGMESIKRLFESERYKTYKSAMEKASRKAKEADARWRERKLKQINRGRIIRLVNRMNKLYTKPTKESNVKEGERVLAGKATALAKVIFAEKVEKRDVASLEFPYATERELLELTRYRELLARREEIEREIKAEMDAESRIIDLSHDDRLSAMVKGVHGSKRYNLIRDYILNELSSEPIVLSDNRIAVVDRRDAQHIARNAGDKKAAEISHIKQIVERAKFVAEESSTKDNKFDKFLYYEALVKFDGETIPVYVNVGRAKNDSSYHIYDITQKIRDTAHRVNDVWRPVGNAIENGIPRDSISQNTEIVKPQSQTYINSDGAELDSINREIESLEELLSPLFERKEAEIERTKISDILGELASEYGALARSDIGYIQAAYDEDAYAYLDSLAKSEQFDGRTAKDMTSDELETVYLLH